MAKVTCPIMSTWASGSLGKTITVSACFNDNKFHIGKYKSRSGKRSAIQIENAQIFTERQAALKKAKE